MTYAFNILTALSLPGAPPPAATGTPGGEGSFETALTKVQELLGGAPTGEGDPAGFEAPTETPLPGGTPPSGTEVAAVTTESVPGNAAPGQPANAGDPPIVPPQTDLPPVPTIASPLPTIPSSAAPPEPIEPARLPFTPTGKPGAAGLMAPDGSSLPESALLNRMVGDALDRQASPQSDLSEPGARAANPATAGGPATNNEAMPSSVAALAKTIGGPDAPFASESVRSVAPGAAVASAAQSQSRSSGVHPESLPSSTNAARNTSLPPTPSNLPKPSAITLDSLTTEPKPVHPVPPANANATNGATGASENVGSGNPSGAASEVADRDPSLRIISFEHRPAGPSHAMGRGNSGHAPLLSLPSGEAATQLLTLSGASDGVSLSALNDSQGLLRAYTQTAPTASHASGQLAHVMVNQVAIQIASAVQAGIDQISIQLKPASLGRIDVELTVNNDGRVQAVVQAERADTLELLQRDARELAKALEDAGLMADSGGLSFSLREGDQESDHPAQLAGRGHDHITLAIDEDGESPSASSVWAPAYGHEIDIRV
jgi:flagellar hook-length control protein FliK